MFLKPLIIVLIWRNIQKSFSTKSDRWMIILGLFDKTDRRKTGRKGMKDWEGKRKTEKCLSY